jgi:prepilin-type N-terminal cleavage/methylation domain-containing protein
MSARAAASGSRPRRVPGPSGFTLIELTVALLILTVMAAVAAPALLGRREPPPMEAAQGRLEALFRMARDSAVRTAMPVTVVVDSASGLVWLDARTPMAAELPEALEATPGGAPRLRTEGAFGGGSTLGIGLPEAGALGRVPGRGERLELPGSVRMQLFQTRSLFTFAPNGAALGDSILLLASTGEARLITVDPWSGRARAR